MENCKYIVLILIVFPQYLFSQTTETFESEVVGTTAFSDNGQGFLIVGANFDLNSLSGGGWNGSAPDNRFIDNTGETAGNDGTTVTIKTDDGTDILVSSFYVFAATTSLAAHSGSLTVTGKKDNTTVYTFSKSSGYSNVATFSPNNGYTFVDFATEGMSDYSDDAVDEIIISTSGNLEYVAIDALTWSVLTTAPSSVMFSTKAYLEGAYSGTNMSTMIHSSIPMTQPYSGSSYNNHSGTETAVAPHGAVDWVLVELREAVSAATANNATKVGSAAGFLMSDGSIKATNGTDDLTISLSGNSGADFYIVVYHRNHLPIMSSSAISESGGIHTIDFTTGQGQAFGSTPMVELTTGVYGMIAGDQNADGQVNGTDLANWRTQNGSSFSYAGSSADFNLDGQVNAVDRNDFQQPNSGRSSQVPSN